jgi:hypothetical protein
MKTEDLIAALSAGIEPASAVPAVPRRMAAPLLAGLVVACGLLLFWLGLAPWGAAVVNSGFWLKITYAVSIGLIGLVLAARLSVPTGRSGRLLPLAAVILVAAIVVTGARQLMAAPDEVRMAVMMGKSWTQCSIRILAVATPIYIGAIFAMRSLAPMKPTAAGAAAGLLSGGVGAAVYALHCPEYAPAFIAIWYTLGMAVSVLLGALLGSRLLRWR